MGCTTASQRRYTTTKNWNRRRKIFLPAAMVLVKAALPRPRYLAPPPDRSVQLARVGFLVGHRRCLREGAEQETVTGEINLERGRPLQSALTESFRQWVFDVLLQRA